MALATILCPRSTACRTQFYCLYMSSVAAKRSHMIIPTTLSSVRRMSSVDTNLSDLQSKVKSMTLEVELLRKDRQVLLQKHKDPVLKEIELEMSKDIASNKAKPKYLPVNFEIEDDSSASVSLKRATHIPGEVIWLHISEPISSGVPLHISVGSDGILPSQIQFYCTIRADGYKINEIKVGKLCRKKKMPFDLLPEIVKRRFYHYLESRGVSSRTTGTIYEYMVQKQRKGLYKSFKKIAEA